MKLSPIIGAIRTYCPRFENRVGGAAEYIAALESNYLPLPSAYVIPGEDATGEQRSQTDYWQALTENFSVAVFLKNTDERAQEAACDVIDEVRREIWQAILGWEPESGCGAIEYDSSDLIDVNRARLVWQFNFKVETDIHFESTRQYADINNLHDLHTVSIDLTEQSSSIHHNTTVHYDEAGV